MSIPSNEREQILVSSTNDERQSQAVIVKGTYWNIFSSFGNLHMREFGGAYSLRISESTPKFHVTNALDGMGALLTDRFWLWKVSTSGVLSLLEIEPFVNGPPTIYDTTVIATDIVNIRANVTANNPVAVYCLTTTDDYVLRLYANVKTGIPDAVSDLNWSPSRLANYDTNTFDSSLIVAYMDVHSPPNIYTEDYSLTVPQLLTYSQVGVTLQIQLTWDTIIGTEGYRVERSINDPLFGSSTVIYSGTLTSFTDNVPSYLTTCYYYRVKQELPSLDLESSWSTVRSVVLEVSPQKIIPTADATVGVTPFTVSFGITILSGDWVSFHWDFGDGNSSDTKLPTHVYNTTGWHTVILTAVDSFGNTEVVRKPGFVRVGRISFSATPSESSTVPSGVFFTNTSAAPTGYEFTNWHWDFGDVSIGSGATGPSHIYNAYGNYNVSLTAKMKEV